MQGRPQPICRSMGRFPLPKTIKSWLWRPSARSCLSGDLILHIDFDCDLHVHLETGYFINLHRCSRFFRCLQGLLGGHQVRLRSSNGLHAGSQLLTRAAEKPAEMSPERSLEISRNQNALRKKPRNAKCPQRRFLLHSAELLLLRSQGLLHGLAGHRIMSASQHWQHPPAAPSCKLCPPWPHPGRPGHKDLTQWWLTTGCGKNLSQVSRR